MRRFVHDHSLAIVLAVMTMAILVGQSFAGYRNYDEQQMLMHSATISYPRYLVSSDFFDSVMSNWQSEFLQISLYVMFAVATIYLRQRGSTESKPVGAPHDSTGV